MYETIVIHPYKSSRVFFYKNYLSIELDFDGCTYLEDLVYYDYNLNKLDKRPTISENDTDFFNINYNDVDDVNTLENLVKEQAEFTNIDETLLYKKMVTDRIDIPTLVKNDKVEIVEHALNSRPSEVYENIVYLINKKHFIIITNGHAMLIKNIY
jgi:hypothetical protein